MTPQYIIERFQEEKVSLIKNHPGAAHSQYGTERESAKDYEGRVIFEFFQNAIDRAEKNIVIQLLDDRLIIGNDGSPFSIYPQGTEERKSDFHALCTIHDSSKIAGESVGNKGVGFKSVWNISKKVLIESITSEGNCWGFTLYNPLIASQFADNSAIEELLNNDTKIPSFYFPKFQEPQDQELFVSLSDRLRIQVATRITIFLDSPDTISGLKEQIKELDKTNFCFLQLLKTDKKGLLEVYTEVDGKININNNHNDWKMVDLLSKTGEEKYEKHLIKLNAVTEEYKARYSNLPEKPNVAIAFPPSGHHDFDSVIYTYLPTRVN